MARSREFWDKFRSVFNPQEILVEERAAALYVEREHSPYEDMKLHLRRSPDSSAPTTVYFTGHRGSGKSSLLFRLLDDFGDDYFPVYFDIEHNLDTRSSNQIDLLYLIGAAIYRAAEEDGYTPDPDLLKVLVESVYTITEKKTDMEKQGQTPADLIAGLIVFIAGMAGGTIVEKLAAAASKSFTLSSGVDESTARERKIEPQVQTLINYVNLIIADVEAKVGKPLLVIIDGLDKIERLEQARLIYTETGALSGPVCNLIYTVPMLLINSSWYATLDDDGCFYILPNIRLYERNDDNKRYEAGYEYLKTVVEKRLALVGGSADEMFDSDALDILTLKSGGVMRWFIRLMRDASYKAEQLDLDRITRDAAIAAVDDETAKHGNGLTREKVAELRAVHAEKRPSESELSSELIHSRLIVTYRNRRTWFDAHPIIWDEL